MQFVKFVASLNLGAKICAIREIRGFLALRLALCAVLLLVVAALPAPGSSARGEGTRAPAAPPLLPAWFPHAPVPLPPAPCSLRPGICDPALARALAQADPEAIIPAIVVLREQAEPERVARLAATPVQARALLVADLQALADRTQAPLRAFLEAERAAGRVESYTPFWIFNGIAVHAHPETLRALATRPEVALVRLDRYRRYLTPPPALSEGQERGGGAAAGGGGGVRTEWNIARVRAPEVWATLGVTGTGAVVAGMDTGADWLHPALQANYRGYNPHGPASHRGNWYDPVTGSLYPVDDHGHGTHTLGTAVGGEGIGVAPGARWIAVKVLNRDGYGYDSWIHAGFQWLLAPAGDPALAPDVVNCSWGDENGFSTEFQPDLRALRAAGVFVVFANGNSGPGPGTVISPASLPEAFAVGATDAEDRAAYFSSRGPPPGAKSGPTSSRRASGPLRPPRRHLRHYERHSMATPTSPAWPRSCAP